LVITWVGNITYFTTTTFYVIIIDHTGMTGLLDGKHKSPDP